MGRFYNEGEVYCFEHCKVANREVHFPNSEGLENESGCAAKGPHDKDCYDGVEHSRGMGLSNGSAGEELLAEGQVGRNGAEEQSDGEEGFVDSDDPKLVEERRALRDQRIMERAERKRKGAGGGEKSSAEHGVEEERSEKDRWQRGQSDDEEEGSYGRKEDSDADGETQRGRQERKDSESAFKERRSKKKDKQERELSKGGRRGRDRRREDTDSDSETPRKGRKHSKKKRIRKHRRGRKRSSSESESESESDRNRRERKKRKRRRHKDESSDSESTSWAESSSDSEREHRRRKEKDRRRKKGRCLSGDEESEPEEGKNT
jgi:hypothetical protein